MEDEFLSISPDRFGGLKSEPYVTRLPDGRIKITATSVLFPEFCPRCGATPANTIVRLHLAKDNHNSVKLPFCRRCGWLLNVTQYTFAVLMVVLVLIVFPRLTISTPGYLKQVPGFVPLIAGIWFLGWAFEQVFKLFFKPRVGVVRLWQDSAELEFEDQMYAEKFVELNR